MTAQRFTVETREQAAIILGAPAELGQALVGELITRGIHAAVVTGITQVSTLSATHDSDYVVLFVSAETSAWMAGEGRPLMEALHPLIKSGASRLITLTHASFTGSLSELPLASTHVTFSDYIGVGELHSQILESWLADIHNARPLTIPGDGLQEASLIGIQELAKRISTAILEPGKKRGSITLVGSPISVLNLAYLVRTSVLFKVELKFDQSLQLPTLDQATPGSSDEFPSDLVKRYFKTHAKHAPSAPPPAPPSDEKLALPKLTPLKPQAPVFVPLTTKKTKVKLKWPARRTHKADPPRLRTIIGRGLVIAIALYLGSLAFALTTASLSLRHILQVLQTNDVPQVTGLSSFSLTYVRANWALMSSLPILSGERSVRETTLLLDVYDQMLRAATTAQALESATKELAHYVLGSGEADPAQLVSQSRLATEELYDQLSLLEGLLPPQTPLVLASRYDRNYQEGRAKLTTLKRSVVTAKALLATAPEIIALGGRRKYAVLFQNNMELRATGGFIGSFALLSFENGKLYDMPIFDVYEADGQLKGHVEPPAAIRDILGEANWYLRDSNFDPDFPTSARRAEWFIQKSLGQAVDGTIAINVSSIRTILRATGALEVPDYNETVSADNLYERAQFHAEVNFFPGSTQKKEFLSTVASALFAYLPQASSGEGIKLLMALADSIEARDTLISLVNPTTAHAFQVLGWDGALADLPCPALDHCHKDYAMVVDSNFGVNKANYFMKRSIEQIITLDKDLLVNHTLRLRYQNTATSTAWPAGPYKNYERIYLPQGTNVSEMKVDGKTLKASDFTLTSQHDRVVLSHLLTVPVSSSVLVEVIYTTPQIAEPAGFVYSWYWQKQPGTSESDPLTVYLNYPLYLKPEIISPTAELAPQQLKFDMVNDTDRRVTVKFSN